MANPRDAVTAQTDMSREDILVPACCKLIFMQASLMKRRIVTKLWQSWATLS